LSKAVSLLQPAVFVGGRDDSGDSWFDCGEHEDSDSTLRQQLGDGGYRQSSLLVDPSRLEHSRIQQLEKDVVERWKNDVPSRKTRSRELNVLRSKMAALAYERGLLTDTDPWRERIARQREEEEEGKVNQL